MCDGVPEEVVDAFEAGLVWESGRHDDLQPGYILKI